MVREQARRVDGDLHVGQHVADAAELRDRATELLALLRVGEGGLESSAGDADGLRRDTDAPALEIGQGDGQSLAAIAQQALLWNATILQRDGARVRASD